MKCEAGKVYLVGAGPGDPGLMTARALELVAGADVILHDRLAAAATLVGARPDAELIYVGKRPGQPSMPQEKISELLVARAREDNAVVRLKGGDPFVFGRGGEEALALKAAGVPFEVVPGVTAGIAAPAYAGVPVTHRGKAAAVAFVTGHEDPDKQVEGAAATVDWEALARFPGTLVLYMGARKLSEIAGHLIEGGRAETEPVAIVERGTTPSQRTLMSSLGELAKGKTELKVTPPALTVIGDVATLHDELAWFERAPLFGIRVTVTRARAQAGKLAGRLRQLGADVVEAPVIRIEPGLNAPEVRAAIDRIGDYRLICLTSPNGAALLFEALAAAGRDARALHGARVAAIGPGTAEALHRRGIRPDIVPRRSVAEGLVEALEGEKLSGLPVLLARARGGRDVLPEFLRGRGAQVDDVSLYESVAEGLSPEQVEAALSTDYVTFTSASTVNFFLDGVGPQATVPAATRLVSIGPATSAALRDRGVTEYIEAREHTPDGLIDALLADARGRQPA